MENARPLARTVLELADEIEAAEHRIKEEILNAAQRSDLSRVQELVERWLRVPAVEVLAARTGEEATC